MPVVVTQLVVDASGSKQGVADYIAAMKKAEQQAIATGDATARSFERTQAQWVNSLSRIDPVMKAQIAMEKDLARQREINANAVKLGITTQDAANAQIVKLTQYHKDLAASVGKTTQATTAHVNATKLQRYEMINLGRQLQDVGVSLFSGQSFLTVGVQQGTQILDIAASSGVKVTDMFKQVGSVIGSAFTATRVLTGGVIALGAAAAYTAIQWDDANKAMERSMIGPGARTGTSVNDISKFAKDNASAFGLSVSEARNAAIEFTKTGEIQIAGLKGLGAAVHGYAVLTGTEAPDATKKLADVLSGDLGKAVLELSKTYSGFDANTRASVQSMVAAGDRAGAQQVIIDKMAASNLKAADSVGVMTKAWTAFKNIAGEIVNPSPPQRESPQEQLATAKSRQAEFQAGNSPFQNERGFGDAIAADVAKAQKAVDSFNAEKAKAELANLSLVADGFTRSIIPQIDQIEALKIALGKLREAEAAGGASPENVAAQTAAQNQLQALRESTAESVRYNQQVALISQSWGNVGQAVALQLQQMQNALPVAQAWTNATRMRAQEEATYLNLINKGLSKEEASAVAAKEYELSKAAAVASAQKLVQSSEDNLDKIRAQGTEMEGVVASSIAYRDAIQSGATATQAAAIAANTLAANIMQAAKAADQLAQNEYNAKTAADQAFVAKNGQFAPTVMSGGQVGAWSAGTFVPVSYKGGGGGRQVGIPGAGIYEALKGQAEQESGGIAALAGAAFSAGGIDAALSAVRSAPNKFGISSNDAAGWGYLAGGVQSLLGPETSTISDKVSVYDQLVQLQNSQTTDKGAQAGNIQAEIAWLKTLPASIERDQKIVDLTQSIETLTSSTDSLTKANQDLLSPYYTQDPRTSHIGFRSQGMATTGYVDIPGTPSANDNMTLTLPVASGERVFVGNGPNRGSGGGGTVINIHAPMTFSGPANRDEVGRTVYQNLQSAARGIQAAQR